MKNLLQTAQLLTTAIRSLSLSHIYMLPYFCLNFDILPMLIILTCNGLYLGGH